METNNLNINTYIKCLIHELKTPMTSLSLGLNTIEEKLLNIQNTDIFNIINDLYKVIDHMNNTLTKFCIIENNNIKLNKFELFDIVNLINIIITILQYKIKEKNIIIEYNIDKNVNNIIYGDLHNIKHVIINLLNNAIKYNEIDRTNIIKINISNMNTNTTSDEIIISIIDNNNHIRPDIKENIFKPFNSTSGSGLGLYICDKIIKLHNGIITHEYLENIGNKFDIIIKLQTNLIIYDPIPTNTNLIPTNTNLIPTNTNLIPTNTNPIPTNTNLIPTNTNLIQNKYNIIIVDDSIINLKLMQNLFKNNNIINNIITATDGLDAIYKIYNNINNIDIVFIDNMMPNLTGVQTINLLRGIKFDKLIFGITGESENKLSNFNLCDIDYIFYKPLTKQKINIIFNFLNKKDISRYPNKKLILYNEQLKWI
jgi:CheY-like chemotaxis protein